MIDEEEEKGGPQWDKENKRRYVEGGLALTKKLVLLPHDTVPWRPFLFYIFCFFF